MTAHIESEKKDIAKTVLMPGDPLRAKYIAEKFLDDVKLVNDVRNMYGYTGKYKGKEVTVFASGMGCPSAGIYAYELYKFYDVENIIRIGTCGSNNKDIKVLDIVLAESAYSLSSFAKLFSGSDVQEEAASKELNDLLKKHIDKDVKVGGILTSDVFDVYVDHEKFASNFPNYDNFLATEMEAFALFHLANILNKKAACLLTVVDSKYDKSEVSSEDREKGLDEMILIALNTILEEEL